MKKFGKRKDIFTPVNYDGEADCIREKYLDEYNRFFNSINKQHLHSEEEEIKQYFIHSQQSQHSQKEQFQHKFTEKRKMFRLSELEYNNLYSTLDVNEKASQEQIRTSYKTLVKRFHPDKGGDPEKFKRIGDAYRILNNELCRRIYDKFSSKSLNVIEQILKLDCADISKVNCQEEIDFDVLDYYITLSNY
jgi:hypothetical protein